MTNFPILAPAVQAILRSAASQVLAFDPDLARDLADLASDYAGPYVDPDALLSPAYAYQKDATA